MIAVQVDVDWAPVRAILDALSSPALEQVVALALNDTVANTRVEAAQQIAAMTGLPSRDVKDDLAIEPARPDHLTAAVVARRTPRKMIQFRPRVSRTSGVSIRIAGKVETYRHAFLATVRHGHKGIFERKPGAARLPIRELYGPSVGGMFARRDVTAIIQQTLMSRFLVNLARQLDRRIRPGGKAPAAPQRRAA